LIGEESNLQIGKNCAQGPLTIIAWNGCMALQ
jgi:hypothetical protein